MVAPLVIAGIASAVGALGAAGMSYYGQKQANRENIAHSREQMAFQERMSSTAYQRSTEDMRQAGINPAVAYSQGGASTPTGSQPPGSKNRFENIASALSLMRMATDIQESAARAEVAQVTAKKMAFDAKLSGVKAGLLDTGITTAKSVLGAASGVAANSKASAAPKRSWYQNFSDRYMTK